MPYDDYESVDRARDRSWYGDTNRRLACPECGVIITYSARAIYNSGFNSGVRWGIMRTTKLSPHVAKFVELITWLFEGDVDEIMNTKTTEELKGISSNNKYSNSFGCNSIGIAVLC